MMREDINAPANQAERLVVNRMGKNMKTISGMESAYKEALSKHIGNMPISTGLVIDMVERISELENAVIDLKASLRTRKNTSNTVIEQYKDL